VAATPARLAGVGVFVLAGLVLFAVGLFMIGDRQMAFSKTFTLYAEFAKITGLQPGAIVRVSGAKAGSVKQILPPNSPAEKFRVRLDIREDLHALVRTDSVASIATEGLVGGSFLAIGTGTSLAPLAPPGSTIAGKEPFDIADLLDQMGGTIRRVNLTIDDLKDDVQRAVHEIGSTAMNANELLTAVSADVKTMASSGSRIAGDIAEISNGIKDGKGTLGKFVKDDEFYLRATAIARSAEEIAANTRDVIAEAHRTLETFNAKDGPVQGVTSSVRQTLDDASAAMSGFAENMDALKHNFLVRGFFNKRGYFDLADISPAQYRQGVASLTKSRRVERLWLRSDDLFASAGGSDSESLTAAGKAHLNAALVPFLEHAATFVLIVEGYAHDGLPDEQYVRSRARAAMVRQYLIGRLHLDPQATGLMPMGAEATASPDGTRWDGIALGLFLDKEKRR
jgi:phospholipid/cholesterol/gamma-HCH transport system substrate-binding protein